MLPAGDPPDKPPYGLIVVMLLLFLAILVAGALFYQSQEEQITGQVTRDLSAIASLKAGQIASWREDRLFDARVLSSSLFLIEGVDQYLRHGDDESREKILGRFREMNTSFHYQNVVLVDPEGEVRLSLDNRVTAIAPDIREKVAESLGTGTAVLTDFYRSPQTGQIHIDVIAPLILDHDSRNQPVGAVILSIDPGDFLYPYIQSWPVPSETAETLLVERQGDTVLFLNELRHQPGTALNLTIPLTQSDVPAVMAVLGTTGAFAGRDYRNVGVISVLEPVRGSPWYIVAKVDAAEAYAAWRSRSILIIVVVAGTLAGALLLAGLLWQRRQKYYYRSLFAAEAGRREYEEQDRERMGMLLRLSEMDSATEQELADFVLNAAGRITRSPLAFLGVMTPDESVFEITAWSRSVMKDCSVAESPIHFAIARAGIWAEAVRQRKPQVVNDYTAPIPGKKGLPPGHVPVTRFVSVPIFDGARIVMVCAVANKDADYSQADVDNLTLLMQGVWNHIRKRKADEALRQKNSDLEAAFEEITASEEELKSNYEELARNQQALKETTEYLSSLFDSANAPIIVWDPAFRITRFNHAFERLTGCMAAGIIGKPVDILFPPETRERSMAYLRQATGGERWETVEIPILRKDGTRRIVLWNSATLYADDKTTPVATIAQGQDITERKAAEVALRESEVKFRETVRLLDEGYYSCTLDGVLIEHNLAFNRILGFDPESDLTGRPLPDFWQNPSDRTVYVQELQKNGVVRNFTIRAKTDAGQRIVVLASAHLVKDEAGRVLRIDGTFTDITSLRMAKEALAESEARYREFFTTSRDAVFITTPEGEWIDFNDTALEMFGYANRDDLMGLSLPNLYEYPKKRAEFLALIEREGYVKEYPVRLRRKDTTVIDTLITAVPLKNPGGSVRAFIGSIRDVTEQMRAQEVIRTSERELDALFRGMINAFALFESVFDENGNFVSYRFIRINDAYERVTGVKNDEVRGRTVHEVWPGTEPEWIRAYGEVAVTGVPGTFDLFHGPTNKLYHCNVYRPGESRDRFCVIFEDITDRKKAEERLRQSEEKYRILFTRMIEGSALHEMIYDESGNPADYRILDVNPSFESILVLRREEIVGKTSREVYGVDTPPYLETYARVAATGRPEVFEVFFEPMNKFFSISVFSPEKGKFATIFEDITDRKKADETRERLIRELEQKNAELERFTYTVSHDLKSPLITIKGFAGLLEGDVQSNDPLLLKKDVSRIITAADTMQALLSDLLELARVGKISNPPQKIAFGAIAREAVDLLAGPLAERGVTVEIAPDLPDVFVDHARIREVLVNLIENAIKFSGNRPDPVIRIGADRSGAAPVFFVADNGIGINPRYLDRIFNLFERLDVTALGTGIGLTIVRRIIEGHGGKIRAESEGVGKGTVFRFTLTGAVDPGIKDEQQP